MLLLLLDLTSSVIVKIKLFVTQLRLFYSALTLRLSVNYAITKEK